MRLMSGMRIKDATAIRTLSNHYQSFVAKINAGYDFDLTPIPATFLQIAEKGWWEFNHAELEGTWAAIEENTNSRLNEIHERMKRERFGNNTANG